MYWITGSVRPGMTIESIYTKDAKIEAFLPNKRKLKDFLLVNRHRIIDLAIRKVSPLTDLEWAEINTYSQYRAQGVKGTEFVNVSKNSLGDIDKWILEEKVKHVVLIHGEEVTPYECKL